MRRLALLLVVLTGCAHDGSDDRSTTKTGPASAPEFAKPPSQQPARPATRVELTAVTLADDCGGTPPWHGPEPVKTAKAERSEAPAEPKAKLKADSARASVARRCEQTSMQLAIFAGDASSVRVKSVELFDDAGKSLGMLSASKPIRWSDSNGQYEPWDQMVAAGSTSSVSYVLAQPKWDQIADRWNRTYTLKTMISVGGVDQASQKDVLISAPTSLPPNVKT